MRDQAGAPPIRFDGQVAIVTGAGSGLGRSYALELAARGAAVVCNDVVPDAARATAHDVVAAGGSAVPETSSVATPAGGQAIVAAALDAFGSLEIVVNNAGRLRTAAFADMSVADFDDMIGTHLAGAFYVTQPAFRHMVDAGYGRVLFTSSSARFGSPWQAGYAAAKAGLIGLCNVVALEGAEHGITANAIMPMALTGIGGTEPVLPPEQRRATVEALRPLLPAMTVENVTPLVLYLVSRECTATQQVLSVGAGNVARVVVSMGRGWWSTERHDLTPEDVAAGFAAVGDDAERATPGSMDDASRWVASHRPGTPRHAAPDR